MILPELTNGPRVNTNFTFKKEKKIKWVLLCLCLPLFIIIIFKNFLLVGAVFDKYVFKLVSGFHGKKRIYIYSFVG